ncbi:uncharacterized protein H6S33_004353 [Morchella sextelata]|uniref:uncharacterized protein n=1 Tax=Morchella sextelata TaxID=1174677 RepID=UPI001D043B26|nr:uncharacterized protein H6S33_004353 [Morchella sextelata]KAH0605896.1 hypothetical protein H6S33_004353 [Morchella sextelata]
MFLSTPIRLWAIQRVKKKRWVISDRRLQASRLYPLFLNLNERGMNASPKTSWWHALLYIHLPVTHHELSELDLQLQTAQH